MTWHNMIGYVSVWTFFIFNNILTWISNILFLFFETYVSFTSLEVKLYIIFNGNHLSIRFSRTLFLHSHLCSPNSNTYLSVIILCFAGTPFCPFNKGYPQFNKWSPKAHLSHIHPNMCRLQILVSSVAFNIKKSLTKTFCG